MQPKQDWKGLDFWAALLNAVLMVLVALRIIDQAQGEEIRGLVLPLISAILGIVLYIVNSSLLKSAAIRQGLLFAMNEKEYLTPQFWMVIINAALMVFVTFRIIDQTQSIEIAALAEPLVTAVLGIVVYIVGRGTVQSAQFQAMALRAQLTTVDSSRK